MADLLDLDRADDGHLFKIRVLNTGEERIARYHHTAIGNVPLSFPCFADPERPDDTGAAPLQQGRFSRVRGG